MDEQDVRDRSQQVCDALVAGDIGRATEDFSTELRSHLGEVVSQLPLPVKEGSVESVEHGAKGLLVVIRLVGESDQTSLHVRWKDRDGKPTIVEVSHVTEQPAPPTEKEPSPGGDEPTE
jgi:hypothetical protein